MSGEILIPSYSIAHKGGEDGEAIYSVSRLVEDGEDGEIHVSVAKGVGRSVAAECAHFDAKEMGFNLYCIKSGPRDCFYAKGGEFVGHTPPAFNTTNGLVASTKM